MKADLVLDNPQDVYIVPVKSRKLAQVSVTEIQGFMSSPRVRASNMLAKSTHVFEATDTHSLRWLKMEHGWWTISSCAGMSV